MTEPYEVVTQFVARKISEDEAVARLVSLGFIEADAREQIYFAVGGDDVVFE